MNKEIPKFNGRNDHELSDSQIQEAFDDICMDWPEETLDSCINRVCESMAVSKDRFEVAFKDNAGEQKVWWEQMVGHA